MLNKEDMNRFDDIEHMPLRVYNRSVMCFNILDDLGSSALEEYMKIFSKGELKQIRIMNALVKGKGVDEARRMATKGLEFSDEDHQAA